MLVDVVQPSGGMSTRWIADSGVLDLFMLLGPKPADVMAQYARLTGPTAMPQVSYGWCSCAAVTLPSLRLLSHRIAFPCCRLNRLHGQWQAAITIRQVIHQ
jgi:hypothetical protein